SRSLCLPEIRMHFWLDVARVNGRRSFPVNTSLNRTMSAFVNMSVGSFCGMSGAEAQTSWPFSAKKERKEERTSDAVFELMAWARVLALGYARHTWKRSTIPD